MRKRFRFLNAQGYYTLGREPIGRGLLSLLLLPGVSAVEEAAVREALRLYAERSVDFADAYLAALGLHLTLAVATFEGDLGKLGITVLKA